MFKPIHKFVGETPTNSAGTSISAGMPTSPPAPGSLAAASAAFGALSQKDKLAFIQDIQSGARLGAELAAETEFDAAFNGALAKLREGSKCL